MSSQDDLNSTTKGLVENVGQFVNQWTAPGQTLSTTASPAVTVVTALGTSSLLVIGSSAVRRAIEFHNSNPAGTTIWVVPSVVTAVVNRGIPIVPGGRYEVPPSKAANVAFNAIAGTGSANVLTIVEFF